MMTASFGKSRWNRALSALVMLSMLGSSIQPALAGEAEDAAKAYRKRTSELNEKVRNAEKKIERAKDRLKKAEDERDEAEAYAKDAAKLTAPCARDCTPATGNCGEDAWQAAFGKKKDFAAWFEAESKKNAKFESDSCMVLWGQLKDGWLRYEEKGKPPFVFDEVCGNEIRACPRVAPQLDLIEKRKEVADFEREITKLEQERDNAQEDLQSHVTQGCVECATYGSNPFNGAPTEEEQIIGGIAALAPVARSKDPAKKKARVKRQGEARKKARSK